ncbi:MAG: 6-aminohexanoate-dimer hydrolase [Burkholderiales bacterium]|nr:6-aminohexanoate-dimer hydrolase [Burkholderiales bacterium]
MAILMQGFPPEAAGQVTLANWRSPPFNRWGFQHVRELIPTADIANDPRRAWNLDPGKSELDLPWFSDFLAQTDTDGLAIVHRGRLVLEHYANGTTAETPHILMSVSKSMLGLLVGILASRKELALDALAVDIVPELKNTAYRGATLRQLLDMRTGVAFDEDYLATTGPMIAYRKSTGWNPVQAGETPSDLRSFYKVLTQSDRAHGGAFRYTSPNTDLLGWVIERASGGRYADLMSELLWKPLGAERSAYITVDRLGAPRCAGGMCTTLRDLARVGQMMVEGGRGIVPREWIDDLERGGDRAAWDAGNFAYIFPGLPMRYRAKWYALDGEPPMLFAWGIHGQHLFVDRAREIAIAKFSSQAQPVDVERMAVTLRAVGQIRTLLAG